MNRIKCLLSGLGIALFLFVGNVQAQKAYTYETVPNDLLKTRIYTLDNGLKVYLTVYKDAPRIQTAIAVRAGSKNDPKETTGLAHYFEHMMFKGTQTFGTSDYKKEGVLINKIDSLFEVYRFVKDTTKRKQLYHVIDSISFVASKYAIPNEYDKLMSLIGAEGTNAYTSFDETVFIENVPSNQFEDWAIIQSDRFTHPVLRLFHTELETIYEEKNMTLTQDARKIHAALLNGLFPHHTYGTQTTIGEAEHIKNPSMKNIREFFAKYYVPNNMAICLSGDLNPDEAIKVIDKYFGGMKPGTVPAFTFQKETPITAPIVKEVYGQDAESVAIAYRFNGANSDDELMIQMIDMILANSNAGLIDLNLNQQQKVLNASSSTMLMKDYSAHVLTGKAKTGQSLDEVRDLLLSQIELIKKGDFPDWLPTAIINDYKLMQVKQNEDNYSRAMNYVESYIKDIKWSDEVAKLDKMSKITKQQIIDFVNKNYNNDYVIVYKRTGEDKSVQKVSKPDITPIEINREAQSEFYKGIEGNTKKINEIEPVFIDYNKDIVKSTIKNNIPIYYRENTENKTFNLYYIFDMGSENDKALPFAVNYIDYLGTSKYSAEQIKQEFYKLGADFKVRVTSDRSSISLSGLSENMDKALVLLEELLSDAKPDADALADLVNNELRKRENMKMNPRAIMGQLIQYGIYGPKSPSTNILSEEELKALKAEALTNKIKELSSYEHFVVYYGDKKLEEITQLLNKDHKVPAKLKPIVAGATFTELPYTETKIYFVNYNMKQAQLIMLAKNDKYTKDLEPIVDLFNNYFGNGMNSIVFQELREARSLAYSSENTFYNMRGKKDASFYNLSFIQTQSDKLPDALSAFYDLLDNMPESQFAFDLAKSSIIQGLRNERITKIDVLMNYLENKKLGNDYDIRKDIFTKVPGFTFADVKAFQQTHIKGQPKTILVVGNKDQIDFKALEKYGKVQTLELKDIYGY